jgi:superfamily II DNA or RNA helicase
MSLDPDLDLTTADDETEHPAPAPLEAREYQEAGVEAIFSAWQRSQATLLILPTGTGKTIVAAMVCRRIADESGDRTLFLAHREELINQAASRFSRFNLDWSIEMAQQKAPKLDPILGVSDVVIATVQSLQGPRLESWPPDSFGCIITDEAHHARARSYRRIYQRFPHARHLGMTATADRGDGKNLGAIYESIAYEYSLRQAITEGQLCPLLTVRLYTTVNLEDIKTTGGDFNDGDLAARVSPHIEELADAMRQELGARPTIVFVPDVGCAEIMADALRKKGLAAADVSGRTPRLQRRALLEEFTRGVHQVLVCCDLLIEGWDCPRVSCVVICRPTRKRSRYAQMVGRGTRLDPASDKQNCLIIDFAWETTADHALVTPFDLFDDSSLDEEVLDEARKKPKETGPIDVMDRINDAEQAVRQAKLKARITGKIALYHRFSYDPVGVGTIMRLPVRHSLDYEGRPASDKQLSFLHDLGMTDCTGLTSIGASRRIAYLEERRRTGLATVRQVALLQCLGVDQDTSLALSVRDASDLITILKTQRGRR